MDLFFKTKGKDFIESLLKKFFYFYIYQKKIEKS